MVIKVVVSDEKRENLEVLESYLNRNSKILVKGKAKTGRETISLVMRIKPDVLVMSCYLPDLAIINIIKRIMKQFPTPILILVDKQNKSIMEEIDKLNLGIVDSLQISMNRGNLILSDVSLTTRVHILSNLNLERFKTQIRQGLKQVQEELSNNSTPSNHSNPPNKSTSQNIHENQKSQNKTQIQSRSTASSGKFGRTGSRKSMKYRAKSSKKYSGKGRSQKIIVMGTSTGGPRLLSQIIPRMPSNLPPVIIIQHMPIGFISAFASRLNRLSDITVVEASDGDTIVPGTVYLAPGGKHLKLLSSGNLSPKIILTDDAPVNFVKPAVDVTLKSATKIYGDGVVSVILTGMGRDGKEGSKAVKEQNGVVLALREKDSEVFGMNRSVIEAGLADEIISKKNLISKIILAIEGKI